MYLSLASSPGLGRGLGMRLSCHITLIFNVYDICDALFSLRRVGGAKNSFLMVYKFPVKYSSLEDVLCSNHYHS